MLLIIVKNTTLGPYFSYHDDECIGIKNEFKIVGDDLRRVEFLQFEGWHLFERVLVERVELIDCL